MNKRTDFHNRMMARVPTKAHNGANIWNYMKPSEIDWNSLEVIGAGAYGAAFGNGVYAVKIGSIDVEDVEWLVNLSKHGRAIPIYGFWRNLPIPEHFVRKFNHVPSWGSDYLISRYVDYEGPFEEATKFVSDVQVMGLAKPLLPHTGSIPWELFSKADRTVAYVARQIRKLGYEWNDEHAGNIGRFGRKIVVLDA